MSGTPFSRCAVFHFPRAEHVEIEWTTVLSDLVRDESMEFRKHAFDQRRVAAGMIGVRQIFELTGIVREVVKGDIAGREERVE